MGKVKKQMEKINWDDPQYVKTQNTRGVYVFVVLLCFFLAVKLLVCLFCETAFVIFNLSFLFPFF